MSITAYSVHAGSEALGATPEATYARFLDHVGRLGELCRARGIRLGVETMYPAGAESSNQYLLQNAVQVERFLQAMPDIDLVLDLAYLNLWKTETTLEKLHLLRLAGDAPVAGAATPRLLEIHLSDNDGCRDSHTTITDHTWWVPYVAMFPPHVPLILESRMNHQSVEQVRQQIAMTQSRLHMGVSR